MVAAAPSHLRARALERSLIGLILFRFVIGLGGAKCVVQSATRKRTLNRVRTLNPSNEQKNSFKVWRNEVELVLLLWLCLDGCYLERQPGARYANRLARQQRSPSQRVCGEEKCGVAVNFLSFLVGAR